MTIFLQAIDLPTNGPWPPVAQPNMNIQTWARMLLLAHGHGGWRPTRVLPRLADFDSLPRLIDTGGAIGDYGPGTTLDRAEAAAFGRALMTALDDVPRESVAEHKLSTAVGIPLPKVGTRIDPVEWFSGERRRELVRQVAQYALYGPFAVR